MSGALPKAVVVVLTWNGHEDTWECLKSLSRIEHPNCEVLLVDNSPLPGPALPVCVECPPVRVIRNDRNLGFAEGNNVGIRYALDFNADYVFLLNNDAIVEPDTLTRLLEVAQGDPQIGILCPTVTSYFDHAKHYVGGKIYWNTGGAVELERSPQGLAQVVETDYAPGCSLLIKAQILKEIALLDPAYFAYFEDVDLSLRCKKAGYRVVVVPEAEVFHKGTMDQFGRKSQDATFYFWRNRVLFMRRHAKARFWPSFLKHYVRKSLERYQIMAQCGEDVTAEAILDACWAGLLGHYGAQRTQAPAWFKGFIRRRLGLVLWLTGWLYFWDYHKAKRQKARQKQPAV